MTGSRIGSPDAMTKDHARVYFPPPLIHGAGIVFGIGLDALFPMTFSAPGSTGLGGGLLIVALLIAAWGFRAFVHHHNPVAPHQPINGLMTGGPFRYTRNPLYLALALLHAGIGLVSGYVWMLLTLLPTLLIVRYYVIAREEAYLTRRFGAAYLDYQTRVRRWI